MNISVLILTYNEEQCLRRCLDSVSWSDDIVVLDSFSTDSTASIARSYEQVRFQQRRFDDFSAQRNFGLHTIRHAHEYLFLLDADEICPPDLHREMIQKVQGGNDDVVLYYVRRKLYYKERWLRHNTMYPVWIGRLARPQYVRYSGIIHEHLRANGQCGFLSRHIDHDPFCKGVDNWMKRRIVYSNLMNDPRNNAENDDRRDHPAAFTPVQRRYELNRIYKRLPFRWLVFLLYNLFVRMSFLDGWRGIEYIWFETWYEYVTYAKQRRNGADSPADSVDSVHPAHRTGDVLKSSLSGTGLQ